MLYYDRIEINKETDPTKSNISKECMICQYMSFNHGLKFQGYLCKYCHDLTIWTVNINDIAIVTIKNFDYCCFIHNISISEAINLF